MSQIEWRYIDRHPASAARYKEALSRFPGGITHDGRAAQPFPLSIERAAGAYKWDADGHQLIDFWMGHGALLLGHGPEAVVAAAAAQLSQGTHLGGSSPHELRWAELVQGCFPGMERVRFTASGTEATMLAVRLARAFTGRPVVARFAGHFHGWGDPLAFGAEPGPAPGLLPAVVESTLVLNPVLEEAERALAGRDDIAALFLEPTGASYGTQPLAPDLLRELRELTRRHGVLLICDEVITGFRVAPGGQQQRTGITADLTCLAKIVAGGLPGGAVGGRADIMAHLELRDREWNTRHKIRHHGTYNANPLSAAAGCAMLERIVDGQPQRQAAEACGALIDGFNGVLREAGLRGWGAYGDSSIFHMLVSSSVDFAPGEVPFDQLSLAELKAGGAHPERKRLLRLALLNEGLDLMKGSAGFISTAHGPEDIAASIAAFERAIAALREEGLI